MCMTKRKLTSNESNKVEQIKEEMKIMKKDYIQINDYICQMKQKEEIFKKRIEKLMQNNVDLMTKLINYEEREQRQNYENILARRTKSFSMHDKHTVRLKPMPKIEDAVYETMC